MQKYFGLALLALTLSACTKGFTSLSAVTLSASQGSSSAPAATGPAVSLIALQASQTSIASGQSIGLNAILQSSAAITGATVEVDVVASAQSTAKLASQVFSNQSFTASTPLAISWTYASTLPVGNYCAAITVSDSSGNVLLSSNNCATAFAVMNSGYARGVNIMDLASAGGTYPGVYGTDYTKPDLASLTYLQSRGLKVVRLPFLWERVQPTAGGALDPNYLGLILDVMHDANTAGIKVMLDMHNYGRYFNNAFGDGAGPSQAQFADAWSKIAIAVQADAKAAAALYAYDVMNEPYGLTATATLLTPQKVWEAYSQSAVSGIRSTNDHSLIMIEGYFYASAQQWPQNHPVAWIADPANNSMYQAHLYLDNDGSGTYQLSHASELADAVSQGYTTVGTRAIARVKNFTDWVSSQNVRGFVGEVGWPNSVVAGTADGASWNSDGDALFSFLDSVNMGATMWACGTWQSATSNILEIYLLDPTLTALSPAMILEAHPSK